MTSGGETRPADVIRKYLSVRSIRDGGGWKRLAVVLELLLPEIDTYPLVEQAGRELSRMQRRGDGRVRQSSVSQSPVNGRQILHSNCPIECVSVCLSVGESSRRVIERADKQASI